MFCACVGEKSEKKCIDKIKKAVSFGADLVELRIDYLKEKYSIEKIILASNVPVITVNRGKDQNILIKAINFGVEYIDMDVNEIDKKVLELAKLKKCKVILSYHNFENVPSINKLCKITDLLKKNADIVKIVAMSKSAKDNKTVMSLYQKVDSPLIAFCMGKIGQPTRIECLALGAPFTYCGIGKSKTAKGQIDVKNMKKIKIYCVLGKPIGHSISPIMHKVNFNSIGMNAVYVPVHIENLEKYVNTTLRNVISGANITIPYKVKIINHLDKIDALAKKIGAVNTVQNRNGKLTGYNTDAYGALETLKEKVKNLKNKNIVILGSGGAARAIYFILKKKKANIIILAKNAKERAEFENAFALNNKNLEKYIRNTDILINCTPVGMNSIKSLVPKKYLKKGLIVFDIVYTPIKTKLIKDAESVGCRIILGYKMLVYQGAKSFKIWTGLKPNIPIMLEAVKEELLPNIALIGGMGVGKTIVGKALSKTMKRDFVDIDKEIEKEKKMSITKIFKKYGENYFRDLEIKKLKEVLMKNKLVVSCGGGIVLKKQNRNILKSCVVILLTAKPETILKRIKRDKNRPLLDGLNKKEKIEKIIEITNKRKRLYNISANYSINTDNCRVKNVVEKIMNLIA